MQLLIFTAKLIVTQQASGETRLDKNGVKHCFPIGCVRMNELSIGLYVAIHHVSKGNYLLLVWKTLLTPY